MIVLMVIMKTKDYESPVILWQEIQLENGIATGSEARSTDEEAVKEVWTEETFNTGETDLVNWP